MATRVRVETAGSHARDAVANLMQLYLYDICEYEDGTLDEGGLFDLGHYFDLYWIEAERHPFLIWDRGVLRTKGMSWRWHRRPRRNCLTVSEVRGRSQS